MHTLLARSFVIAALVATTSVVGGVGGAGGAAWVVSSRPAEGAKRSCIAGGCLGRLWWEDGRRERTCSSLPPWGGESTVGGRGRGRVLSVRMDGNNEGGSEAVMSEILLKTVPRHVGIIMDGNRRYARRLNMPDAYGHKKGKEALEKVVRWVLLDLGIQYLTVYALSSENIRKRAASVLFELFAQGLDDLARNPEVHQRRMCVRVIGSKKSLPQRLQRSVQEVEEATRDYNKAGDPRLTVCLAYGGREEIVNAARCIAKEHASGSLALEDIDEDAVAKRLYTSELPDPDLVIRTSGEERVSNFLLWQIAYSELFFSKLTWPEFDKRELLKALQHCDLQNRRYGQ